jgi:hypothetical protein
MSGRMRKILQSAYEPCAGFSGVCKSHCTWDPKKGHVPRGFYAMNEDRAELIIVTAEPGDPAQDEVYNTEIDLYQAATENFLNFAVRLNLKRNGKTAPFHRNMKKIVDLFYPDQVFEDALEKIIFTNAVLCSAPVSGGVLPKEVEKYCGERYLKEVTDQFNDAFILALGGKAQRRMRAVGISFDAAAHHPSAYPSTNPEISWKSAAGNFATWKSRRLASTV